MTQAIFLSYASQDADAARRICDALRAAGLEVWFDQSELRGGDAWDASIRKQIKECALFVPMISCNTQAREEGYFRLEWKLAVDRSHLMADNKAFFVPVLLGDVSEPTALVPDKFRERQWSQLNDENGIAAFAGRVAKLLAGSGSPANNAREASPVLEFGSASLGPQAHDTPSIAVLAFANRSASADDEYFSDGLADELLNVLAKIKGLRVAARTSAFSFKGKQATIAEIGRALNVATVLEGSVRKSGTRARITVQLVNVADGYQLWSETYDRTLDDVFAVQDEIAQSVVTELRNTLMGELKNSGGNDSSITAEVAHAAIGRSDNAEAYRLVLQAGFLVGRSAGSDYLRAIDYLREALRLDPGYALAWAALSRALTLSAALGTSLVAASCAEALQAAKQALQLQPELVEGHLAMATYQMTYGWDWDLAEASLQRALQISPNGPELLSVSGLLYGLLGKFEKSLVFSRSALERDPLNARAYGHLARTLAGMGRADEAGYAFRKALELSPDSISIHFYLGLMLSHQNRHDEALAEVALEKAEWARLTGISTVHFRAGRIAEADEALRALIETNADNWAVQIAMAYTVRGDADAAFQWLERAYVQRDSGLAFVQSSQVWVPLQNDPRWPALLKKLGFRD